MTTAFCGSNCVARPRQRLLAILSILLTALLTCDVSLGGAPSPVKPEIAVVNTCVLELSLPQGAKVIIDGRDYGRSRRFVFRPLDPGKLYESNVEVRNPKGRPNRWRVPIEAGQNIKLGVEQSPSPHVHSIAVQSDNSDVQAIAGGSNALAFDLYSQLAAQYGNLVFSPVSLESALGMVSAGAAGQTSRQMSESLHLTLPPERLHPAFAQLLSAWNQQRGATDSPRSQWTVDLVVANRLWLQAGTKLRPDFVQLCRDHYGSDLQAVDFTAGDDARLAINDWVAGQTEGKIKELIAHGALTSVARLVLTNAVYFQGKWMQPFDPRYTTTGSFRVSEEKTVEVPMMHQQGRFGYCEQSGLQVLELPYAGGRFSLVVLLPSTMDGLGNLETQLSSEYFSDLLERLKPESVAVSLPRFLLGNQFQLGPILAKLGMPDAFSTAADFSGISDEADLRLSDIVHQSTINIYEEGTEAVAASGALMELKSIKPEAKQFRADHPFVFLLRDQLTGAIMFLGRLVEPEPGTTPTT